MLRAMQDIIRSERKLAANAAKLALQTGISIEKAKAQLKDQIRQQVLDIAKGLDPAVRGKLIAAISKADTWQKANRVVERLASVAEVYAGRKSLRRLRNMLKPGKIKRMKGLTDDLRERLAEIRAEAENQSKTLRTGVIRERKGKQPTGGVTFRDIMAARAKLDALEKEAALEISVARSKFKQIKGLRGETAESVAKAAIEKVTAKKKPIDTGNRLVDAALKLPAWFNLNAADMRTILARVEGADGPLFRAIYIPLRNADTRRGAIQRELTQEADKVAKDAGFDDFDDARAQLSSFAGRGATKLVDVSLGGKNVKITLGQALALYGHSTDPATRALIARGLEAVPDGGEDTARIAPLITDLDGLRKVLEAEQKGITKFIDGAKRIAEIYWPERKDAVYRLTGIMPPDADGRFRRDRYYKNPPADKVPASGRQYAMGLLENEGTNQERVETAGVPILLRSPADILMDDMRETADIVAMAETIRDVMNILENEELTKAVSERHPGVIQALKDLVAATYVKQTVTRGGKAAQFVGRNVAVSVLAANVSSILVNLTGSVRTIPDLRPQDWIAAKKDVVTNGMALFRDLKERSGYFHERYNTAAQARVNMIGTSQRELPAVLSASRAFRKMWKNIKAADPKAAYMDLRDATGATLELYNLADAPLSVEAYAAKIRESKAAHKGWTEEQHRDWAAVEAEQLVRDTQPGHGSIDAALMPVRVRGELLSAAFMLTSDFMRARNRINLAFHKSMAYGTQVLAAETVNIAFGMGTRILVGYAMGAAFLAMMGGDDDDQQKLFEDTFEGKGILKQFALNAVSMGVPVFGGQAATIVGGFGGKSAVMPPAQRMIADAMESVPAVASETTDALYRWMDGRPARISRLLRAWAKGLTDATSAGIGNPFHPYIRRAMDAAKRAE
jgi:hypothetical protein